MIHNLDFVTIKNLDKVVSFKDSKDYVKDITETKPIKVKRDIVRLSTQAVYVSVNDKLKYLGTSNDAPYVELRLLYGPSNGYEKLSKRYCTPVNNLKGTSFKGKFNAWEFDSPQLCENSKLK